MLSFERQAKVLNVEDRKGKYGDYRIITIFGDDNRTDDIFCNTGVDVVSGNTYHLTIGIKTNPTKMAVTSAKKI